MNFGHGPRRLAIESMWRWASRRTSLGGRGFFKGVVVLIGVLGSPLHAYQYWKREKEERQDRAVKETRVPTSFDDALRQFTRAAEDNDEAIGPDRVISEKASFLSVQSNRKIFEYFLKVGTGQGLGVGETKRSVHEVMRTRPENVFRAARLALQEMQTSGGREAIRRALADLSDTWVEATLTKQSRDLAQRLDRRVAEAADPTEDNLFKSHPYPADRKAAMRAAIFARAAALEAHYESDKDDD